MPSWVYKSDCPLKWFLKNPYPAREASSLFFSSSMLLKENQININEKNKTTSENAHEYNTKEERFNKNIMNNRAIDVTTITYFPYNDTIIAQYKCLRDDMRKEEDSDENQQKDTKILTHSVKTCRCSKGNSVSIRKTNPKFTFKNIKQH